VGRDRAEGAGSHAFFTDAAFEEAAPPSPRTRRAPSPTRRRGAVNPLDAAEPPRWPTGAGPQLPSARRRGRGTARARRPPGTASASTCCRASAGRRAWTRCPRSRRSRATARGWRRPSTGQVLPMFMTSAAPSPGQGAGDGCRRRASRPSPPPSPRRGGARLRRARGGQRGGRELGATFVDLGVTAEGTGATPGSSPRRSWPPARGPRRRGASSDVVITTAAVPGRKAPVLLTAEMVDGMGRARSSSTWPPTRAATAS